MSSWLHIPFAKITYVWPPPSSLQKSSQSSDRDCLLGYTPQFGLNKIFHFFLRLTTDCLFWLTPGLIRNLKYHCVMRRAWIIRLPVAWHLVLILSVARKRSPSLSTHQFPCLYNSHADFLWKWCCMFRLWAHPFPGHHSKCIAVSQQAIIIIKKDF